MAEFVLYPTVASGLSLTTWRCPLPAPEQWLVYAERPSESALTLAGTTVHSFWPTSVTSATPEYRQAITDAKFQKLLTLVNHATVTSWMLLAEARVFEVGLFFNGTPERFYRGTELYWRVSMTFKIVSES